MAEKRNDGIITRLMRSKSTQDRMWVAPANPAVNKAGVEGLELLTARLSGSERLPGFPDGT